MPPQPNRIARRPDGGAPGTAPGLPRRSLLAGLVLPLAGAAGCSARDTGAFPRTSLTIATGNHGGVFARYGAALSTVIEHRLRGVTATARTTDASVENVRLVSGGRCDLGFSLGDTATDAVSGSGAFGRPLDLVALARLYDSFVHLVVRADSPVRSVADLRGRRVGVGARGSGTRVVSERVLRHSGLATADIDVSSGSLESCTEALREGRLAAFFFVSGFPGQAVLALSRQVPIRLIGLREVTGALIDAYGSEYVAAPIPASTYGLASAVDTVSVRNYLVAGRGMPDRLAYAVTRLVFEARAEIRRLAPGVRQPSIGAAVFTSPLDLHPGAVRWFRENRG
ncbi:TAXI family TRAP transporter solute-binding subunit [Streptomyces meridianus]|uniref:TAXI family TRAP transporter solute-binding subunit n=1 Tax=Streptomyces meridianus TaxID=2938945 RepID=A0ABT0X4J9_9ACTN|nr:TAXI family TRAP transporter solute-binding subunit [Streptomyces meridianus]MCM2577175.1 TAXI family TRAP transporter solute-binding subunit [Streptomyces meridianus]